MDDLEDFKKPGTQAQNEFFTEIMAIMIRKGINQSELARRLNVSRMAVSQMFKNQNVTLERADKVAHALGKSLHVYLTDRLDTGGEL